MAPPQLRRLVLVIDLHPLLSLPSPSTYLLPILAAARRILPASMLSSHMPFFSSLPPILSSSALHRILPSPLSPFDLPVPTFLSLSRTLNSLQNLILEPPKSSKPPRASLVAQSLFQLACDCAWDDESGNLVLVISPLPRTAGDLEEFVGSGNAVAFLGEAFAAVKGRLARAGVSLCWVDVNFDGEVGVADAADAIRGLGWGVSSTDAIALGSKLVPFGMMVPGIWGEFGGGIGKFEKKGRAELYLEIADVGGQPLECKSCTLELFDMGPVRERSLDLWGQLSSDCNIRISVKGIRKNDTLEGAMGNTCGSVMLRGPSVAREKGKKRGDSCDDFFGNRILELLCGERWGLVLEKPMWQLILVFLYRRDHCALVSVARNGSGSSLVGMIKPYTVNSAVLTLFDNSKEGDSLAALSAGYVPGATGSNESDKSKKLERRKLSKICNLSWSAFRELILSQEEDDSLDIELEEVYLAKEGNNSKKLRFLQCWMKQMKRSAACTQTELEVSGTIADPQESTEDATVGSQQERGTPFSSSPPRESEVSLSVNEEPLLPSTVEDIESFVAGLSGKIEHGLCSEAVDLGDLAERLVELATRAFYVSFQRAAEESQGIESTSTDGSYDLKVVAEVSKLLLLKPRDLAARYKDSASTAPISKESPAVCFTDKKVREHELQILFRMEILRSSVGIHINDSMKAKMIKDICSLLENIEFNLEGGVFTGESLIDFVERTIKTRYSLSLGEVIHKIYTQMEFFSFNGGTEEYSISAPNSHHNDEATQDKLDSYTSTDVIAKHDKRAIEGAKSSPAKTFSSDKFSVRSKVRHNKMDFQLTKALEMRERARRLSHFTGRTQNLQRVWAPKHNKTERLQHEYPRNMVERRRRRLSRSDMVMETPIAWKKSRHSEENDSTQEDALEDSCSSRLLSKPLFGDEFDT